MKTKRKRPKKGFSAFLTPYNIAVAAIFTVILFLRLWRVGDLFNFTFSEEMQAVMAWEQVKNFHPIWIGVSAANINFYLGPGFTYLNAFLFYITKDPVILAYFSAILGLATTASVFYTAKDLFSKKVAFYATIMYGCSALLNFHDRRFWNPTPIAFITVWWIYSLIKAQQDTRWYIVTAIGFASAFHTHLSLLLLMVPTIYSVFTNFKKIKLKTWALTVAAFLVIYSPLIVFDVVHNYDNISMPFRLLGGHQKNGLYNFTIADTITHIKEFLSALGRLWFIDLNTDPQNQIVLESHNNKTPGHILLALVSLIALGWFFIKNRSHGYKIFFIALITIFLAFALYPSYNPEYYLMSFLTLMAFVIGYWLASMPKMISTLIVAIFVVMNFLTVVTMSNGYGLTMRKHLVEQAMKGIGDKSFSLYTDGSLPAKQFTYAGWRYLFKAYGRTPSQSSIDTVLGWIYPDEVSKEKPELRVIVADTIQRNYGEKPLVVFHSGPYHAYIFKNGEQ